jgi:predicted RNase H-like HicB family nuclease
LIGGLVSYAGTSYIVREYPREESMRNEFTAIVEQDNGWFIAYSPEVPGANGQGRTKPEALKSLADAIGLVLMDRSERNQTT